MVDGRNHPHDRASDPLASLRRAVDDLHQAVDERSSLGAPGLDLHRYGVALTALARVLPAVESGLVRHGADGPTIDPITTKLLDDCRDLGIDVPDTRLSAGCAGFDEPGARWGASYVLHGSRLGAAVIADRLADDLPDAPRSYFDAAADGARPAWAAFRVAARRAFDTGGADLGRAIDTARAVFAALLSEFDPADVPKQAVEGSVG